MRIGVLGGSFDPPHVGHFLAAVDAYEALSLDKLILMPTAAQPLKTATPSQAPPRARVEMLRLTIGDDPRFEVSEVEIHRGGLSYTVETLEAVAAAQPGAELFLILGMDAMATFDRWKSPARIRELATLAVLQREGVASDQGAGRMSGVTVVGTRRMDVSSSEVRRRVQEGKSIRGFVAESVERYISTANLYRSASQPAGMAARG